MKQIVLMCLVFCILLCGCAGAEAAMTEPEPAEETPEPEQRTEKNQSQLALVPDQDPDPEPMAYCPPGMDVIVDGVTLESGSIFAEGALCVKLEELAAALHTEWSWNDGRGGILWRGQWIDLRSDVAGFRYGSQWEELPLAPLTYEDCIYVPVKDFCRGMELGLLQDPESRTVYVSAAAGVWEIPEGHRVPIIMYHGVTDDMWGMTELFVRPSVMEAHLQYLVENGFTPIWFEDLERVDEIEKPVILTFDDGYADNYHELYPLLQKYQAKATIFVITGTIDYNPHNLTTAQIKELSDSGLVSIQSHTVMHPLLATLTPEEQQWELEQSRLTLTRITVKIPYVICYPSGNYNSTTMELAQSLYRLGLDMNGGDYDTSDDPYEIKRWYIARSHPVEAFIGMVG